MTQYSCFLTKLTTSREIRLASRPKGIPTVANFTLAEAVVSTNENEVLFMLHLGMNSGVNRQVCTDNYFSAVRKNNCR